MRINTGGAGNAFLRARPVNTPMYVLQLAPVGVYAVHVEVDGCEIWVLSFKHIVLLSMRLFLQEHS